jgi:hypothetical protein
VPLAAGLRLSATEVRCGWSGMSQGGWYMCQQEYTMGAALLDPGACLDCSLAKNSLKLGE